MEQDQKFDKRKKTNRLTIIGFLVLFALPVVMAWVAYFNGWYEGVNTTNKGEWVKPIITLEEFNPIYSDGEELVFKFGEKWKLIYPHAVSNCQDDINDETCLINLYLIGQTYMALTKERDRVERIIYNGNAAYSKQQLMTQL